MSEVNNFIYEHAGGKTPTITGWQTAPTNLTNATDGDYATGTGTGQVGYAGTTSGTLKIDLGNNVNHYKLKAKYKLFTDGGSATFALSVSEDDSSWTDLTTSNSSSATSRDESYYFKKSFRYVRFSISNATNPGSQLTIYEVQVF